MDEKAVLETRGLSKHFGGIKAVDNVDLMLREKEIMAVVGDNGAGKSTLIKTISGVYKKDGGAIVINGQEVEIHDPLEEELITESALYDRDRNTATIIDIGDEAPIAWQFGGDYRNIQYDFGEIVDVFGGFLFVDRILDFPDLIEWRIFSSSDPDGRIWTELDPQAAEATYTELSTGLQGWELTLSSPVSARFIKIVDVKLAQIS